MTSDRDRLSLLLARLRELELRTPPPHEQPIHEVARGALADELSQLSHRLFDLGYTQSKLDTDGVPRVAC